MLRQPTTRGAAATFDAIVAEARGELIARLDDDAVALPDRIARQVEIFDRYPETGVVHGDAVQIDDAGRAVGALRSADHPRRVLIDLLVRGSDTRIARRRCKNAGSSTRSAATTRR